MKPPRKPWKSALYAWLIFIAVMAIAGSLLMVLVLKVDNPRERGELFGNGLAPLSMIVAGIAYWRSNKRYKKYQEQSKVEDVFR